MLWSAVDSSDKHCAVQNGTCGRKRQNRNQTVMYLFCFVIANKIRVPFSSLIGVPKNGGPNWTKNKKNTKCQITKKSYHYWMVLFEKWINEYFWYSVQTSIRTGKGFVLKALAKSKWFLLSLYPALF